MELSQTLGYLATILFSIMYIPQVLQTLKSKSIVDVSAPMFIIGFIANLVALTYATMINQRPLQIKYIIALIVIGIYLIIYYKIRGKK